MFSADDLFFAPSGLDRQRLALLVENALGPADDGELFLEAVHGESFVFDDGRLKKASYETSEGFGLRAVAGEATGYAHSNEISEAALQRASKAIAPVYAGQSGVVAETPKAPNASLYPADNPIDSAPFDLKIETLEAIDRYARAADPRVSQVSVSLTGEWQVVEIVRPGGGFVTDVRPLVRLNVAVVVEAAGRREQGSSGRGGRQSYAGLLDATLWQAQVDEALRQALVNLDSIAAPAGETTVVLGPGWPGILLHEAVGHGLEGDFNRKKTSAFAGLLGERVASPGVTVIDDGTIDARRGS
ncbi:MAG: metallopeptidase TldD-related protein, partial [Pseudomonadota bacterium]